MNKSSGLCMYSEFLLNIIGGLAEYIFSVVQIDKEGSNFHKKQGEKWRRKGVDSAILKKVL